MFIWFIGVASTYVWLDAREPLSFPPQALAQEISQRFDKGSAELAQFIDHYSKRAQLEDSLATTIEKTVSSFKHGAHRHAGGQTDAREENGGGVPGLVSVLQGEVEMRARMHLHLSERLNNEVVKSLSLFTNEAWHAARDIRAKVSKLADEMRGHHEQIPKLSARAASKAPRSTQQRLDEEKRKLIELQRQWQNEIAGMVSDFEAADVARMEVIRESVFRAQHYQSEFFRAVHDQTGASRECAKHLHVGVRIVDEMVRPKAQENESVQSDSGFLKLGIFRSKTRRVRKKDSKTGQSIASSDMSQRASSIVSPGMGSVRTVQTVQTVQGQHAETVGSEPPNFGTVRRSLDRHGNSFVSTSSAQRSESTEAASNVAAKQASVPGSVADEGEWVFAGHSQASSGGAGMGLSADSLVHVTHSLAVIEEGSVKSPAVPREIPEFGAEQETLKAGVWPAEADINTVNQAADTNAVNQAADTNAVNQAADTNAVGHAVETNAVDQGVVSPIEQDVVSSVEHAGTNVTFDDLFMPLEQTDQAEQADTRDLEENKTTSPAIDLDTAFSIPAPSRQHTETTHISTQPLPAPMPIQAVHTAPTRIKSPLDSITRGELKHRRNSSMAKDTQFDTAESDADVEQMFRVNFSIRERAIEDNPDETRAALSRVTTMLRAAPVSRRRNRREVRTMYVAANESVGDIAEAQTVKPVEPVQAVEPSGEQEPQTPVTPMPQRQSGFAETELETGERTDVGAAVEDMAANAEDVADPQERDTSETGDVWADAEPEESKSEPEESKSEKSKAEEEVQLKTEGTVRRRAPPPPPPSVQAASIGRSVQRTSSGSLRNGQVADDTKQQTEDTTDEGQKTGSYRGRRGGSNGPLGISMHAIETLDFSVQSQGDYMPELRHKVTGSVELYIREPIEALDLAPLRITVRRPIDAQWVANPSVVVLDTTSEGERYRFVRPDLFAHSSDTRVTVFKYQTEGSNNPRVLPLVVREACTKTDDSCALMLFVEPNVDGVFGGSQVEKPAVLVSVDGTMTTQASRPSATWFKERNTLLWNLDSIRVPERNTLGDDEVAKLGTALVAKMGGRVRPVSLALRFEAQAQIVDFDVQVGRVAGQTVVEKVESRVVKSGKCVYVFYQGEMGEPVGHTIEPPAHETEPAAQAEPSAHETEPSAHEISSESDDSEAWSDKE
ncbi:hypothetical protein GGH96_000579 [Coemansia sp. RSA 1972]|nr:hypothetical protein GGH96_000579 [Coemansia sp. RSA 1972]